MPENLRQTAEQPTDWGRTPDSILEHVKKDRHNQELIDQSLETLEGLIENGTYSLDNIDWQFVHEKLLSMRLREIQRRSLDKF